MNETYNMVYKQQGVKSWSSSTQFPKHCSQGNVVSYLTYLDRRSTKLVAWYSVFLVWKIPSMNAGGSSPVSQNPDVWTLLSEFTRRGVICSLKKCVDQNPSCQNNSCSVRTIKYRILWNPKAHYRLHKSLPLVRILSQINPFDNFLLHSSKICFNTGLFEMIVGVLTTCHTQYTWDRSICIFLFNRITLQVFVTYLIGVLYYPTIKLSAQVNDIQGYSKLLWGF